MVSPVSVSTSHETLQKESAVETISVGEPREEEEDSSEEPIGLPLDSPIKQSPAVVNDSSALLFAMEPPRGAIGERVSPEDSPPPEEDLTRLELEERVQQLETKLAVVSRLLQSFRLQPRSSANMKDDMPLRTPDRAESPYAEQQEKEQQQLRSESLGSTPHLESPAPGRDAVRKTFLEEQALGEAFPTPQTKALEDLVRPPSHPRRSRGISMDEETVACDNRTEKKLPHQPQLLEVSSPTTPDSIVFTPNDKQESWSPSPSPQSKPKAKVTDSEKRRRNLSFRLLYSEDEEAYDRRNETAPSTSSLTLSERLWLGPNILQFQKQQQEKQDAAEQASELQKQGTSIKLSPPSYLPRAPDDNVRSKWLDHLNSFQESTPDVDVQMEEFIKVPARVENLMSFGFFICVDSFLYMITVLPIRFVWSCFLLLLNYVVLWRSRHHLSPQFQFHRQHLYQIIQVTILFSIYHFVLLENSIGKLYHWIRGQAMLKLYVLIAIVEVFDRLFGSLGQDCLESMYWNTVSRPRSSRMLISVLVVLIYASLHSILLFVHVVTLHVAMNSTDQVLLALLISGNFAEIKSTVFKKYNKAALFKISASDICERFKLALFLSLVLILNVCQGLEEGQFMSYVRIWAIVGGAEMMSDWIKHAFITKFNFLPARVYSEYALLLAGDVTGIGHEGVNMDHSHAVVKRIGFAQIPLVCVLFRLIREAARYYVAVETHTTFSWPSMAGAWLALVLIKLALGSLLHRLSLDKLEAAPEYSQQKSPLLKKKVKNL